MTIEHVAMWVQDLDGMVAFYTELLGGAKGEPYQNPATGFGSYFVSFGDGARLELMYRPGLALPPDRPCFGYAHLALRLGGRGAVDTLVAELRQKGVIVESDPRVTGDGYYEAVVLDPERNRVELVA